MDIQRNPPLDDVLEKQLVDLWARVTNAGGAVGFAPPVEPAQIAPLARAELDRVRAGVDDIVVAVHAGQPLAFGFLTTSPVAVTAHVGVVKRLQRDPQRAGRGLGGEVLEELEAAAWDRGCERVALTVRGGTGREGFYMAQGYRLDGRLPGRVRTADGVVHEELHMSKTRPGFAHGAPTLRVRRLDPGLPLPAYAQPLDAGLDLYAQRDARLEPGQRDMVPSGIAVEIPAGYVGLVHPRSGLAARSGVGLVNAPGTIDAGYRGEIRVLLINFDPLEPVEIARGDRIAQLVVQPVAHVEIEEVAELQATDRGAGGFGSTGR